MRTIGLMSGTSLDGVDAAVVDTDGERIGGFGKRVTLPYAPALRRDLRALLDRAQAGLAPDDPALDDAERRLTEVHAEAVAALGVTADLIGFHGQTILHRPPGAAGEVGLTWQIGDADLLARLTGVRVAHDFRSADVAAGGQGAPLVPVFHAVLAEALPKPLAVLNLGGVANLTFMGRDGGLVAFDTGPANGPLDDWVREHTGQPHDESGRLALAGTADADVLGELLTHPYLSAPPPKSLDRLDFQRSLAGSRLATLSPPDGAATLVALAAHCVAAAGRLLPEPPLRWLVAGGGRLNPAIMRALATLLDAPVHPVEAVGWDGDALEAQAFGVLAARVVRGLPLSFPGTTGVARPWPGGRLTGAA
ncbi:anhydro-N-acetylmuramic acid kinase [Plastoroseomonas arctica]|uniref:Anhydro-N-acetylmuramic acid kinase n=1 Tax=Plastoroseomonas arctica TaxID=1509237 RepID=A0AAF1KM79_9PROT|nr:anhydro-N-acetylmuramic acid kinase [Plastoroseomonas arctica]MBR0655961.1 anhydro-N-acetylmuramic acid kinase [Plastoroseomonas arctica]